MCRDRDSGHYYEVGVSWQSTIQCARHYCERGDNKSLQIETHTCAKIIAEAPCEESWTGEIAEDYPDCCPISCPDNTENEIVDDKHLDYFDDDPYEFNLENVGD